MAEDDRLAQLVAVLAARRRSEGEEAALARLETLTGVKRETLRDATAEELARLFDATLEVVARSIRESGSTVGEWEAEATREGVFVSASTIRRLRALVEGEPEGACPVCLSVDHPPGSRPHLLRDGSAPTWPYSETVTTKGRNP